MILRMTDGYGVVKDYEVDGRCPKCKLEGVIKITGRRSGCFDGEHTYVDVFTCTNGCETITYREIKKFNGYSG